MGDAATVTATAPARWLLGVAVDGVALTQTGALARAVVREAAERWPGWWNTELFGPPHREADVAVLGALHHGLRRLRLLRRRGRRLLVTARGRQLAANPQSLLDVLVTDLGGGELFDAAIAAAVVRTLAAGTCEHEQLIAAALRQVQLEGWQGQDGEPPSERDVSWGVSDVLCRGEAYGAVERRRDAGGCRFARSQIALTAAGKSALGLTRRSPVGRTVLVFDAQLMNSAGVRARVAVDAHQHLTALHDAIQEAFGWWDDHLYSFWLDGTFWGDEDSEFTTPETPDERVHTADLPLAELGLAPGARLAYVFDFGDDWRVRLTLREQTEGDGGSYPRVLARSGTAPPQYPGPGGE